jgi:hypothetical protein
MRVSAVQRIVLAFLAGAAAVLVFHQGVLLLAYFVGLVASPPYSLASTPPFGVPKLVSLAFWGGLWGIVMIVLLRRSGAWNRLWPAFVFGGIVPTLVGALVVVPLKGQDIALWLHPSRLMFGFLINGAWGLGTALGYRLMRGRRFSVA